MANIASAKKRARQAVKNRERNVAQRSMIRTTIKKVVKALTAKDKAAAEAAYGEMVPVRAEVQNLSMLSAHADSDGLIAWMEGLERPPAETYVIHGEPAPAEALRKRIEDTWTPWIGSPDAGDVG